MSHLRNRCMESLLLVAENVSKYLDGTKPDEIAKLRRCVEAYCTMETQDKFIERALDSVFNVDLVDIDNVQSNFETVLEQLTQADNDVENNPFMEKFKTRTYVDETSDDLSASNSVLILDVQKATIDPFTMEPLRVPVQNKFCKHVYEKTTIETLISKNPNTRCPIPGCINKKPVKKYHLVLDNIK